MSPASETDICVLLVESDSKRSKKTLTQLVDAGYRVVTVSRGDEAFSILKQKKRKVDLVLTCANLPDMCVFELVETLDTKFRMAVVMICDNYDEKTILRGLLSGAQFCHVFPVYQFGIDNLWQHAEKKKRLLREEFEAEKKAAIEFFESLATDETFQNRKRKTNNLEKVEDSSMGLPSPFTWTHDSHSKFLDVVAGCGIDFPAPSEVLRCIGIPGLTVESVVEKLQEYRIYLSRKRRLWVNRRPSQKQRQLMDFLGATRPLPYVLPNSMLMHSGLMPLANTAQAPSSSTVAEVLLVTPLPVSGQGEDQVNGR